MTPLDLAHHAMMAHPQDDAARLRFYGQLAAAELIVLVSGDAGDAALTPRQFDLEDGPVILAFDTEDRLTDFTGAAAPYAAMPGRLIALQLAGQGVGLGVNLGVAPSSILIPPEAVDWLAETVSGAADPVMAARPVRYHAPAEYPMMILMALDDALRRAGGMADHALLGLAEDARGARRPILALIGADPSRHIALARMVSETVAFGGHPDCMPDVVFLADGDPALQALAAVAHRFDMPEPGVPDRNSAPRPPGMDPDRPPNLR